MSLLFNVSNVSRVFRQPDDAADEHSHYDHPTFTDSSLQLPEPSPNWPRAKQAWRWAWSLHVYGLGSLFVVLVALSVGLAIGLNRRLRTRPLIGTILILVCTLGALKALVMFADPYHSTLALPAALVHLIHGLTFPCVVTTETLLERLLATLVRTRPSTLPSLPSTSRTDDQPAVLRTSADSSTTPVAISSIFQRRTILVSSLALYFVLVTVVYLVVSFRPSAKHWLILAQMVFITWGFASAFVIVGCCVRLSRHCRRTRVALQQIIAYTKLKRQLDGHRNPGSTDPDTPAGASAARNRWLFRIAKTKLDADDRGWPEDEGGEGEEGEGNERRTRSSSFSSLESFTTGSVYYNDGVYATEDERRGNEAARCHMMSLARQDIFNSHLRENASNRRRRFNRTVQSTSQATVKRSGTTMTMTTTASFEKEGFRRAGLGANYSDYDEEDCCFMDDRNKTETNDPPGVVTQPENQDQHSGEEEQSCVDRSDDDDDNDDAASHSGDGDIETGAGLDTTTTDDIIHPQIDTNIAISENSDQHLGIETSTEARQINMASITSNTKTRYNHGVTTPGSIFARFRRRKRQRHSVGISRHVMHTNRAFDVDSDLGSDFRCMTSSSFESCQTEPYGATAKTSCDHFISKNSAATATKLELKTSDASINGEAGGCYRFPNQNSDEIVRNESQGDPKSSDHLKKICKSTSSNVIESSPDESDDGDGGAAGGYLADTELGTPHRKKAQTSGNNAKLKRNYNRVNNNNNNHDNNLLATDSFNKDGDDLTGSPNKRPFSLPSNGNCLGLHRILQGSVIRDVLLMTYAHMIGSFSICVIQVYALFGVFGVLSNEKVAMPWPWYAFQTASRLSELLFLISLVAICRTVGCRLRFRTALRRPHRMKIRQRHHKPGNNDT